MYEGIVQDLIDELGRLPGVGPKSAQRIAFHLLNADAVDVRRLANVLVEVKEKVRFCAICGNVAEEEQCRICRDPRRDLTVLCVVEESKDVVAIERTREYRGRYHVAGGRHGHRGDPRDRPESGGRGDRDIPHPAAAPDGPSRHPTCQRPTCRGRFGVRRRGHTGPRLRRETHR